MSRQETATINAKKRLKYWAMHRSTPSLDVVVRAIYIERQDVWSLQCWVNELLDDCQLSDEPKSAALEMIEAAIYNNEDECCVTATVTAA